MANKKGCFRATGMMNKRSAVGFLAILALVATFFVQVAKVDGSDAGGVNQPSAQTCPSTACASVSNQPVCTENCGCTACIDKCGCTRACNKCSCPSSCEGCNCGCPKSPTQCHCSNIKNCCYNTC